MTFNWPKSILLGIWNTLFIYCSHDNSKVLGIEKTLFLPTTYNYITQQSNAGISKIQASE